VDALRNAGVNVRWSARSGGFSRTDTDHAIRASKLLWRTDSDKQKRGILKISIQPELWVDRGAEAIAFYQEAFDARVLHIVGSGEDIVAQLAVGDAAFWIAATESGGDRLVPRTVGGATGRTLLVVEDPDSIFSRAVAAGASAKSAVSEEHGWRVGRILDPFGHEWEIGKPIVPWPPRNAIPH
jgi:PhnB protein